MNYCVYGASSAAIADVYIRAGEHLGSLLARHGHAVVFGGGASGMMGAVARGVEKEGGELIGVAPTFFNVDGVLFENCTRMVPTKTMRERKQILEDLSDGFILTPGGIGSFDEFFEILTLKQLGQHEKPIVIYNIDGYFDAMLAMLEKAMETGFLRKTCAGLYHVTDSAEETLEYLENYVPDGKGIQYFKSV